MKQAAVNQLWRADTVLAQTAAQGNEQAFNQIFNRYSQPVASLCRWMAGNFADGEEAAQEAWMQAYRKLGMYRGNSRLSTWIHRIAVNAVLMHLRRPYLRYEYITLDSIMATKALKVEPSLISCLRLEEALGKIDQWDRFIFLLHDLDGHNHAEIAGKLDCGPHSVKIRVCRARTRLYLLLR